MTAVHIWIWREKIDPQHSKYSLLSKQQLLLEILIFLIKMNKKFEDSGDMSNSGLKIYLIKEIKQSNRG